jgi:hypothetical protein
VHSPGQVTGAGVVVVVVVVVVVGGAVVVVGAPVVVVVGVDGQAPAVSSGCCFRCLLAAFFLRVRVWQFCGLPGAQ